MKIFHNIAAASAIMLMAACNSANDVEAPAIKLSKVPIEYAYNQTRLANNQFENGDQFAVWCSLYKADGTHSPYFSNQIVTLEDETWTPNKTYYWPVEGHLDFFAIYPKPTSSAHGENQIIVTPGEQPIVNYHITNFADICDIVAAKTKAIDCDNPQTVPLKFQHLLGKIDFVVKNKCSYTDVKLDIEIESLEISMKMHEDGQLNWEKMTIEVDSDVEQVPFSHKMENATHIKYGNTASIGGCYFMPEDIGTLKVSVVWKTLIGNSMAGRYRVDKELKSNTLLESGKVKTITLELTSNLNNENGGDVTLPDE